MADRYWVGGNGSWSSTNSWSTISGGASGASVPTSSDNVIFDANSNWAGQPFTVTFAYGTIANFTFTPPAVDGAVTINIGSLSGLVITGTFSTSGTQANRRLYFKSDTAGITATLQIASIGSVSDVDFQEIQVTGAGGTLSGTRIGNRGNCSNITFSTPKNVYWATSGGGYWSSNNWTSSSGGLANINSFPLAQDTAVFDNVGLGSGSTVSFNLLAVDSLAISSIDMSSRTTSMRIENSRTIYVYGSWINGSGTYNINQSGSGTGTIIFSGSSTATLTSAGKSFYNQAIQIDKRSGTFNLADALSQTGTGSIHGITLAQGTFNTNNYNITAAYIRSSGSITNYMNLGSSTIDCTSNVTYYFADSTVLNAGTSSIVSSSSPGSFYANNKTFYNVSYTGQARTVISFDASGCTFNNLTFLGPTLSGLLGIQLSGNSTINGTLTLSGSSAINRVFVNSNYLGSNITLTVNSFSGSDCDFRNITIAGAASSISPTRAGDCGGNTGITFPAPKTVYWNLAGSQSWYSTGWATSSGGAPAVNNFPLPQDTAVLDNAGSAGTINIYLVQDVSWNIGTIDASARTNAVTLDTGSSPSYVTTSIYKNFLFGSGVTISGTAGLEFIAQSGNQDITCNGRSFGCPIKIGRNASYASSTFRLLDTFSCTQLINVYKGTLNTNSQTATFSSLTFSSGTGFTLGSSTLNLSGTFTANSGMTISASGATIKAVSVSFYGAGKVFSGVTLDIAGSSSVFYDGFTFDNFTNSYSATGPASARFQASTTFTFLDWNASGVPGKLLTIGIPFFTSGRASLRKTTGTVNASFLDISNTNATGGATWNAISSVNSGNNLGWNFLPGSTGFLAFFT